MAERTYAVRTPALGTIDVRLGEEGAGRPALLLHGGAGPGSMAGFSHRLAARVPARVVTPTHPGFDGTPRPPGLQGIPEIAALYRQLIQELGLDRVTVVGNSIGGWIAAEMAAQTGPADPPWLGGLVLVNAAGLDLPGAPIVDVLALPPDQVFDLSYYNPAPFRAAMGQMTEAQRAAMVANRVTLKAISGPTMSDPTLLPRLRTVRVPTLVVWGSADRIVPAAHRDAYASAIPGARLVSIPTAGHMPQLETPDLLADQIADFLGASRRSE